jgi:hypothetical protein
MIHDNEASKDAKVYAWIIAVVTVLLYLGTYSCVNPVSACEPNTVTYTPTPTLKWEYDQGQQNNLLGFRVWWKRAYPEAWNVSRSSIVNCWIEVDEDTGISSRQYCQGTDIQIPLQRYAEADTEELEWTVTAVDRNTFESEKVAGVFICMPRIWRGGPYQ